MKVVRQNGEEASKERLRGKEKQHSRFGERTWSDVAFTRDGGNVEKGG